MADNPPVIDSSPFREVEWHGKQVLLADSHEASVKQLQGLLTAEGMQVTRVDDAQSLISSWKQGGYDLVIVENELPGDGLAAGHQIKHDAEYFVPLIFVTSQDDELSLAACMEAGGDDFLTRPYNEIILFARINSLLRIDDLYRQQYQEREELAYYHVMVEEEQRLAKSIFSSIVHQDYLDVDHIQYTLSPMSIFNGDMLLAARTPNGNEHMLIGDFTGHGLTASIGAMPASEIFYAMTAKGFSIVEIISEINSRLRQLLPLGMFMACCAIEIDSREQSMSVWAGGIPDLVLRKQGGHKIQVVEPRQLPLGVVNSDELDFSVEIIPLEAGDRFYIYTDGVTETENADKQMFGSERIKNIIQDSPEDSNIYAGIMQSLEDFRAGYEQSDDITLLEYRFSPDTTQMDIGFSRSSNRPIKVSTEWSLRIRLDPNSIRAFDPRPVLTQLLMDVQSLYKHRERLYTIMSELFSNALDYGLLKMDSSLKKSNEGFYEYYSERERRLAGLEEGYIMIDLQHFPSVNGGLLQITFEDSGDGFEDAEMPEHFNPDQFGTSGIPLISKLCNDITFYTPGNKVSAVYQWSFETEDS